MNVTEWFDADVKPTIPGWYEREYEYEWMVGIRDYWDGESFWLGYGDDTYETLAVNPKRWRGLAEDPSKKDKA